MEILEKYMGNLTKEFQRASYDIGPDCTDTERLLYLYAYYHYYNADTSKIPDIIENTVYDRNASDKIAGIFVDEDSDSNDVDVIIVFYSVDDAFDFPAAFKSFKDTESFLFSIKENKGSARSPIVSILRDEEFKFSPTKPLKIRIITDYIPKTASTKRSILKALQMLKPEHEYVSYHLSFGNDIEYEILEIENPKEYVDEGTIVIDRPNNFAFFGGEGSIIANVSASSLKELYDLYGYRGLFAQNLRYYVKNAKVDGNIIESIQDRPENFWYYNNGIIIICDDFSIEGNQIWIRHFSIINGGQTTKLIGETDFTTDFFVQCKIIKNKYIDAADRLEFIANVAEASNTQKPIKDKDLIANRLEQRLLKKQLAEAGIYCQIKRGEKVNKKLYPSPWQNTTNEELGQFILSFVYQKPGTARGSKSSICGNKERYNLLFGKEYNSDFLGDLLKIKAYYKLWATKTKKEDDGSDPYKVGLVNNGMFFVTAIIGVVCKLYYHRDYISKVNASIMTEQKLEVVSQHDIDHHLFYPVENMKESMFTLFEYCYQRFYRPGYEFLKSFKDRYNNYSNFTKINNNYSTYIFKQISFIFGNGIPSQDLTFLDGILFQPSDADVKRDSDLLEKYVNVVFADMDAESSVPEETVAVLKDALTDYRTKSYKLHRVKPYEVFKNLSRDRIAKFAPRSIEELQNLRCLDEAQLTLYGEEIIAVVNEVLSR